MPGAINNYLNSLARRLHLDGPLRERGLLEELQAHIEDKAADLEAEGVDRETAMASAVEEMGAPRNLASRMYAVHSTTGVWWDVLLRHGAHFLLAALFALHLWSHYFLVSLVLVGIAFVTWRNWRAGTAQPVVIHLDGLHSGGPCYLLVAFPDHLGLRRLDAVD